MGDIRKTEGEVLVAEHVQRRTTFCVHRDELRPTYPPTIHFKWMVDLVSMPMGVGQMKYLVLAREDLTNQVEGRALTNKTTTAVCKFLLEDFFINIKFLTHYKAFLDKMIEPYFLFPFPFYRFLHAYSACEGTRHVYNASDTSDT